jgi:phosphatidylglycerol:prolipoprotein diacylglycerol transferase
METTPPYEIWFPNIGIGLEHVPRVAFNIFGFEIYLYAVFIVTGIVGGLLLAQWYAGKTGQKKDDYFDILTLCIITSFIGLRIYYVAFNWDLYKDDIMRVFSFRDGGLAIYGGIIGAYIGAFIMSKVKKIPLSTIFDTAAPSLCLGQAIGRWGNFFNREAFGGYTDSLLAMRILPEQVHGPGIGITQDMLDKVIEYEGFQYIQVHPTFFYESICNVVLMFALIWFRKRYKKFPGEVMLMYMLGYGVIRFFIEGIRTDQLFLWGTTVPVSQVMSVVFVVVSLGWIIWGRTNAKKKAAEALRVPVPVLAETLMETEEAILKETDEEPQKETNEETQEETQEEVKEVIETPIETQEP